MQLNVLVAVVASLGMSCCQRALLGHSVKEYVELLEQLESSGSKLMMGRRIYANYTWEEPERKKRRKKINKNLNEFHVCFLTA